MEADGLAAGKGVAAAMKLEEAYEAVDSMLVKTVFGSAGCRVIVEEFLEGEEASFFALVDGVSLKWSPGSSMAVVMASNGYPGSYEKGTLIRNPEQAENVAAPAVKIFHAGTALNPDGDLIATGGRVLGVTATGSDLEEARDGIKKPSRLKS